MLRYAAAIWNPKDEQQDIPARAVRAQLLGDEGWISVLEGSGLWVGAVFDSTQGSFSVLEPNIGVVIGQVFKKPSEISGRPGAVLETFDGTACHRIAQTRGRSMINENWGTYVLVLNNPALHECRIMRGPMSTLPCFYSMKFGFPVFFSEVEDFLRVYTIPVSVNWPCVLAKVLDADVVTHETAIREISEVLCGECMVVSSQGLRRVTYWNPCAVAECYPTENFQQASSRLRFLTRACVTAYAAGHRTVVHTLSGGLDSSIVLSCLRYGSPDLKVVCVNDYSADAVGDERRFARCMAGLAQARLVERQRNEAVDLHMFLKCRRTARPVLAFSDCHYYPENVALAQQIGATAIFNGELGDNVFGSNCGPEVIAEYFLRHGISGHLPVVAMNLAHLRRASVWATLWGGIREHRLRKQAGARSTLAYIRRTFGYDPEEKALITTEALTEYERNIDRFSHPWYQEAAGVPPGKWLLLYGVATITSTAYHSPFSACTDPPICMPLASQPLVEWALTTASDLNVENGRDRALARDAFRDELPPLVRNRTGKSHPGFWLRTVISANRDFLREVLLDGLLVKERLIDRSKVEAALAAHVPRSGVMVYDLIAQLYIEAWLRRMLGAVT